MDNKLQHRPFKYREMKNGMVQISFKGKVVTTLKGMEAAKFLSKALSSDEESNQILMAKATGHFNHGNEKAAKNRRDN